MDYQQQKQLYITGQMAGHAKTAYREISQIADISRDRRVELSPRAQELLDSLLSMESELAELAREIEISADRMMV